MAKFTEEDAYEIVEGNKEAVAFEKKYPNCVLNIGRLTPKKTENWIKKNKEAVKGEPPKYIWFVEYEEIDVEMLTLYVNPDTRKIISTEVKKLKAAPEEE
ncbi:MAG: hypothetical protein GF329_16580 [Candidatus Lokiarchaeota archaeon]|nr:hypothetical protein [Candidatus Lokiarchaeota archaeon]